MPDVQKVLQEEIMRLARKETRALEDSVKKQLQDLREVIRKQHEEIGALRDELERKLDKEITGQIVVSGTDGNGQEKSPKDIRIPKGSVKKYREKLGITQAEMAALLDVNPLTVSNWELGKSSPMGDNRLAFDRLRQMGVREVRKRLEQLSEAGEMLHREH